MTTSAELANLAKIGTLRAEPEASAEIAGLVTSGEARLRDAGNPDLALDSRFDLAYNAAHALALAALRPHGYRCDNRYVVFQVFRIHSAFPWNTGASWRRLISFATARSTRGSRTRRLTSTRCASAPTPRVRRGCSLSIGDGTTARVEKDRLGERLDREVLRRAV